MTRLWAERVRFSPRAIERIGLGAREQLSNRQRHADALLADQRKRLHRLEAQKQKLIEAYLAEALAVSDLKERQADISAQIADAQRLITYSQEATMQLDERLTLVLALLCDADILYAEATSDGKRWLNSAVFEEIRVDALEDDGPRTQDTLAVVARGPFTPPVAAVTGVLERRPAAGAGGEKVGQVGTLGATPEQAGHERTPVKLSVAEGSNVDKLAETVGFEPTEGFDPFTALAGPRTRPGYATSPSAHRLPGRVAVRQNPGLSGRTPRSGRSACVPPRGRSTTR